MLIISPQINIHEVVRLYGEGMTYDALENHLRPWKKQAQALRAEAADNTAAKSAKSPAKKTKASPAKDSKCQLHIYVDHPSRPLINQQLSRLVV
jgi:hypothetical protein